MNVGARISYKQARLKIKHFDNAVSKKSLDIRCIRLEVAENRYEDKEYRIVDHGTIDVVIKIPGGDLQTFNGERTNNSTYNDGVSIYSLLPIEAWTKSTAQLNNGDILIYKYLLTPYDSDIIPETKLQILQVSNKRPRMDNTVLYHTYNVAPYTFNIDEYPSVKTLIENYQIEAIDLWS